MQRSRPTVVTCADTGSAAKPELRYCRPLAGSMRYVSALPYRRHEEPASGPPLPMAFGGSMQGRYFATHQPTTSATPSHSHSTAPLARPLRVQAR